MHRPVIAPQWVRLLVDLPENCVAVEEWTLQGLGQDSSFVIQAQDTIAGLPYSDCFIVWRRYKATAVGESRTQLDAEFQLEWSKPCMVQRRVESGTIESLSADFSEKFLPLVKRTLTARFADVAKPSETHGEGSPQISPQEEALAIGSLDSSGCPDEGLQRSADRDLCLEVGAARYEILVEVKSVHLMVEERDDVDTSAADILGGLWMAMDGHTEAVFLELRLGDRGRRTELVAGRHAGGQLRATFAGELLLFGDEGERSLHVRICSWQQLQAAINDNRHPVLGESMLALDPHLGDLAPRWGVSPVWLSNERVGLVKLQYQALLLCGPCVVGEGAACAAATAQRPARLRVDVLWVVCTPVSGLSLHELLSSVTSDDMLPPEQVFAELELGARCIETACVEIPGGTTTVKFDQETLMFAYSGEDAMEVRVRSRRWPKELVSEVFIGSGTLNLEYSRNSCEPRTVDLPVSRTGTVTGMVSLRYQLFV